MEKLHPSRLNLSKLNFYPLDTYVPLFVTSKHSSWLSSSGHYSCPVLTLRLRNKWFSSFCSLGNSFKTSNSVFSVVFVVVSTAFNYSRYCFTFTFTADGKLLISCTVSSSLQTLNRTINWTFLTFLYYLILHSAYCNGPRLFILNML